MSGRLVVRLRWLNVLPVLAFPASFICPRRPSEDVRGGEYGLFRPTPPPGRPVIVVVRFGRSPGNVDGLRSVRRRGEQHEYSGRPGVGGMVRRQRLRFNYKIRSLPGVCMTLIIDCSSSVGQHNRPRTATHTMGIQPATTLTSVVRRMRIDIPASALSPSVSRLSLSLPPRVCSYTRSQRQPFT